MSDADEEYAVLDDHVDHDRFSRFARAQGWTLQQTFPQTAAEPFFEEVWSTADENNAVHYVDDPRFACRFLRVRGPELRTILLEVARKLGFYDDDELVIDAAKAQEQDEAVHAILRMGVGLPLFRPDALDVYASYARRPDPLVRTAAVQAIAYHHWPDSQQVLADVAAHDEDPKVRDFATRILETSRQKHGDNLE
jgi:hypothetical protein